MDVCREMDGYFLSETVKKPFPGFTKKRHIHVSITK